MTTGEIIKEIMQNRKITAKELAKIAGIQEFTLNNLCDDSKKPKLLTVVKIAKALDVKIEELYPEDSPERETFSKKDIKTNIEILRLEKGMSIEDLCLEAGISYRVLKNIYKGDYKLHNLIKIANALNVQVQELDPGISSK